VPSFDENFVLLMRAIVNVSGQSLPLAVLAVSTLRMKCFWSPYICIFASLAISHPDIWTFLTSKVNSSKMKVHNIRLRLFHLQGTDLRDAFFVT
jgi:hypothetical protein